MQIGDMLSALRASKYKLATCYLHYSGVSKTKRSCSHPTVGFGRAEVAPLHKDPSKAFSLLWLFAPEVHFYPRSLAPYSWVRSGNFRVTSQVFAAVFQTALATCSSERKLSASPHTLQSGSTWQAWSDFTSKERANASLLS